MQEFSQRVCQHVEALENARKKKYKMLPQKTEASAGTAYIFFEESQLQLMFHSIVEVTIVVPLFSFFRHFVVCTISCFAHSLFNVGLLLSSLGSSEGAPPPLQSCFWLFIRISSRVESSSSSTLLKNGNVETTNSRGEHGRPMPWLTQRTGKNVFCDRVGTDFNVFDGRGSFCELPFLQNSKIR